MKSFADKDKFAHNHYILQFVNCMFSLYNGEATKQVNEMDHSDVSIGVLCNETKDGRVQVILSRLFISKVILQWQGCSKIYNLDFIDWCALTKDKYIVIL